MKVFLCGQKYFGWLAFRCLLDLGHDVIGVAAPMESEGKIDRLYKAAIALDIPFLIPGGTLRAANMPSGCDLIICAHSYDYVSEATLAKTKLGGIGYHPSLLPLHRGRDAVRWTTRLGERVTGGTVYWLSKNVDGGPIAAQEYCIIPLGLTPDALWRDKLQPIGIKLFAKTLSDLSSGRIIAVPQDESCATWEPSIGRSPIFRPDLPQIGAVDGFETVRTRATLESGWGLSETWKVLAGG